MEEFAKRLKHARTVKHFKLAYVAEKTGVSMNSIYSWESGRTRPNVEAVKKLIDLYGCSADYLFGLTDKRRRTE